MFRTTTSIHGMEDTNIKAAEVVSAAFMSGSSVSHEECLPNVVGVAC